MCIPNFKEFQTIPESSPIIGYRTWRKPLNKLILLSEYQNIGKISLITNQKENKMSQFRNSPVMHDSSNNGMVKRYVHQPLTVEHYGIHAKITENGRVIISSAGSPTGKGDEVEYDEVEIPASLVFKLATLLKATRTIKFVSMAEAQASPEEKEEV